MEYPCLKLELLRCTLGMENRYSVANASRSVELAIKNLELAVSAYGENIEDKKQESKNIDWKQRSSRFVKLKISLLIYVLPVLHFMIFINVKTWTSVNQL